MASIRKEIAVDAPAPTCWEAVRDFAAVAERLVPGFVTHVEMVSPREREVTFATGAVVREYLVGIDDDQMRLSYTVTRSAMGGSHHNASVQVIPEGDARSRFVWITDVLPDQLAEGIGQMMDRGVGVIKHTLESGL